MAKKRGLKDLVKDLVERRKIIEGGTYMHDAGNYVLAAAKLNCSGFRVSSGELRNSLGLTVTRQGLIFNRGSLTAHIGTNKEYATYVEFGTGPKGYANHAGVSPSPDFTVTYRTSPWWIHESQIDPAAAEEYKWPHIDTDEGRFYRVSGQPAHPYLYPALNDNWDTVCDIMAEGILKAGGKVK